jgi:hypothetical protein
VAVGGDELDAGALWGHTIRNLDLVLSVASYFRLADDAAKAIVAEVEAATSDWRSHAHTLGLPTSDIARMDQAFGNELVHTRHGSAERKPRTRAATRNQEPVKAVRSAPR